MGHILLGILLFIATASSGYSQTPADKCQCTPGVIDSIVICIADTSYQVQLMGCMKLPGAYPDTLPSLCDSAVSQDRYTTITGVCFGTSRPAVINADTVFKAILCALDPCRNPGILGINVPPGFVYCWTIITPKCVVVNDSLGCIYRCGTGCCISETRWFRTEAGVCNMERSWNCEADPTNCTGPSGCSPIACPARDSACCIQTN